MTRVVLVHGVAQQYRGPQSLSAAWAPAICDGVLLAGGRLSVEDVSVAFYGDLFRPPGSRNVGSPDFDAYDVDDPFELDLLRTWWIEAARMDLTIPGPEARTRARTPVWVQRALFALSRSKFFAGISERALIGNLKQVRTYFTDPEIRRRMQARISDAISPDTTVVVGHSLGSIIAYEVLCGARPQHVNTFVTLGSPLGTPNLIFDRLLPAPRDGKGIWPVEVRLWINIADRGDVVALAKRLAPRFGEDVIDILVDNGAHAHDMLPYLTAAVTGRAIMGQI